MVLPRQGAKGGSVVDMTFSVVSYGRLTSSSPTSLPFRCHCDGRSGALEGAQGHSHCFRIVRLITAVTAASDVVLAGLAGPCLSGKQERPRLSATRLRRPRPKWP